MKIVIELEHSDLVNSESQELTALFTVIQAYAKAVKKPKKITPQIYTDEVHKHEERIKEMARQEAEKKVEKNSAENTVENSFDRKKIEQEIRILSREGKEKHLSSKIKDIIRNEYGVNLLEEVPDEKISELLEKVKTL